MIQRKQSVYLVLGALCVAAMLFFDGTFEGRASETLAWYVPSLLVSGALVVLAALFSVFIYRNRAQQQKMVVAVQVLTLIFMILLYGGLFLAGGLAPALEQPGDAVALVLPILAYVFFYLARRGIQADIQLVRSMDRLR